MMSRIGLVMFLSLSGVLCADYVQLRDGRRIEGRIVEERADAIHIETQRNEAGTIRQILVIDATEISAWNSDAPVASGEEAGGAGFEVKAGGAYVERLLREAEAKVLAKEFDGAIGLFQQAADAAGEGVEAMNLPERAEALELRAHALRLLGAALEGKLDHLEMLGSGQEEQFRAEQRRLRREWDVLQGEILEERQRRDEERRVELGSRRVATELEEREVVLREQIERMNAREVRMAELLRELEAERVKTEAHVRLNAERTEQATRAAAEARREAGRRR